MITVSKITKLRPAAVPGSIMAQMNPGPEREVTQIRVQLECGNGSTAIIATANEATLEESVAAVLRQLEAQVAEVRRQMTALGLPVTFNSVIGRTTDKYPLYSGCTVRTGTWAGVSGRVIACTGGTLPLVVRLIGSEHDLCFTEDELELW